jgi:hypothetical protein
MAEHDHQGQPCQLTALSMAMWALVRQLPGNEGVRGIILLAEPGDGGHDSISVFGYDPAAGPVRRVVGDMTSQLAEFAGSFGVHIDVYADGRRLTTGRASPNAS